MTPLAAIKGRELLLAKFRGPVLTFLVFISPMLAGIVLGPFDIPDIVESCLDLLSLLAFVVAVVQVIIALFKRSLPKFATWTLIIAANIILLTSGSVRYLQAVAWLYVHREYYREAVAVKRAQPDYPGFVIFELSSTFDGMEDLVFDESDSLATHPLPAASPLLTESIFVHCRYSAQYLFDHFYSVDIGC